MYHSLSLTPTHPLSLSPTHTHKHTHTQTHTHTHSLTQKSEAADRKARNNAAAHEQIRAKMCVCMCCFANEFVGRIISHEQISRQNVHSYGFSNVVCILRICMLCVCVFVLSVRNDSTAHERIRTKTRLCARLCVCVCAHFCVHDVCVCVCVCVCMCLCLCHRLQVNEEIRAAAQVECLLIVRTSQIGFGFSVQGLGSSRVSANRLHVPDWFCNRGRETER